MTKIAGGARFVGDTSELELAHICRRMGCLPSQAMSEDAYALRRTFALILELDRIEHMKRKT